MSQILGHALINISLFKTKAEIGAGSKKYWKKCTGTPRYIREIGTPKIDLHITNLHIKRPLMTVN
jgi:hypothetical protein